MKIACELTLLLPGVIAQKWVAAKTAGTSAVNKRRSVPLHMQDQCLGLLIGAESLADMLTSFRRFPSVVITTWRKVGSEGVGVN